MDKYFLALIAVLVVGLACAGLATVYAGTPGAMATYSAADNGKTISMKGGEAILVALDENPTTGYSWNVTASPGLKIVEDKYIAPQPGLMGAGGAHQWQIHATGTGTMQFDAVYKRPWEATTGNESTFHLTINVA